MVCTAMDWIIEDGITPTGQPGDAGRLYLGNDADVFEPLVRLSKIYDGAVGVGTNWAEGNADAFNAWVESYFSEDSLPWDYVPALAHVESQCGSGSEGVHWNMQGTGYSGY